MAANSFAGAHRFKDGVDAENEFGHFLHAGIVGAGVEDAQVNGGMLLSWPVMLSDQGTSSRSVELLVPSVPVDRFMSAANLAC